MSPTIAMPFPRSAPTDLLIFDHATWPQTIAGITRKIGTKANERTAKTRLTMANGAIRGAAAPDAAWADRGGGVWSAIAPFYRTAKQKQGAVRTDLVNARQRKNSFARSKKLFRSGVFSSPHNSANSCNF